MRLQLLSSNNDSVMFVKIIGINSKYLMPLNPTPYSNTPPFKAKYFWSLAQIPYFPSTGGVRGGLTSDF